MEELTKRDTKRVKMDEDLAETMQIAELILSSPSFVAVSMTTPSIRTEKYEISIMDI